jgi:hypothetical protein
MTQEPQGTGVRFIRQVQTGGTTMTDPRLDDRNPELDDRADNAWSWVPGALFAMCVVGGVALWAYSSGDLQRSATRLEPDATTGQSVRPPLNPNPARPAPAESQR